ncbi:MAG TPA: LytTR family DNA-binding domain-containing protein [Chitinophagaceae bacterium]|nr:LytTR family DNA-binding domain-containing protein [Chitinophagaceae bacterium]
MKILIVEDEELAVEKLKKTLLAIEKNAEICGVTNSIASTVSWLRNHTAPDLILMDIELSDGQSFEIFSQAEVTSPVVFTTSYDEYAIKAFKVNSVDYLLKPVEEEELKRALDKYRRISAHMQSSVMNVTDLVKELQKQLQTGYRTRFLVKQGQRLISLEVSNIAYFFAEGRLSYAVTWDKQKYIVDFTIEELEGMLDPGQFFRANRAHLIHIKSVNQIHNYFNGKLKLELKPTAQLDVVISREKANDFKVWMGK